MKYSDNKHLCHLTVASCKPLATNEKNRSHETGNYKPNKAIRR